MIYQNLFTLLQADSEEELNNTLEKMQEDWPIQFNTYFTKHLCADIKKSFKGNLQSLGIRDCDYGVLDCWVFNRILLCDYTEIHIIKTLLCFHVDNQ